jgi:hypothetical protein
MPKAIEYLYGHEVMFSDGNFAVVHDESHNDYVAYALVHGRWTIITLGPSFWPVQQRVNDFIAKVKAI